MSSTAASGVSIEYEVTGAGLPVTCFVPGLAQTVTDTRPFGSGVVGQRVFLDLRGQGRSGAPPKDDLQAWTYPSLGDDISAVVTATGATRAVGVSLGAGALLGLAARDPGRFDRLVLALPSTLDEQRVESSLALTDDLADAVDTNDQIALGRLLLLLQPPSVRGRADVGMWARRHAANIGGTAVSRMLRTLPRDVPLPDLRQLGEIESPVLILAQRDDPVHPVAVAERLGSLLPSAQVVVSEGAWIWSERSRLREVVGGFLNP